MATERYKIFNDSVHGHIKMHPLLVDIIDTPEFQRLRNIKQMGGIYYVFPGACHNRFEHSLGVGHLAGELVRSLKAQQPQEVQEAEKITSIDMFCVQIAGLCHDLGHGPFSLLFEEVLKELAERMVSETGESETTEALKNWKHEEQSGKMFNQLIKNGIKEKMKNGHYKDEHNEGLKFQDKDFEFIHELIEGTRPSTDSLNRERHERKSYLYEIVANKETGIDVDKMDYFSRDCHHVGMKSNFSHERYVMFARVCTNKKNEKHICTRDKEAINMYELFHNRYLLHYNVCQHRVKVAIETMIVDVLLAAEGHFKLDGKTISEAVMVPKTYLKLTDDVLQEIMRSTDNSLKTARKIIRRIDKRKIYKFVGGKIFQKKDVKHLDSAENRKAVVKDWLELIQKGSTRPCKCKKWQEWIEKKKISESKFFVKLVRLNYGKDDKDPIKSLGFYRKNKPHKSVKLSRNEISFILPKVFAEIKVMLFYKGNGKLPKNPPIREFWELVERDAVREDSSEELSRDSSEESSDESSEDSSEESSVESSEDSSEESSENSSDDE
ncbi:deoxynucleoside triphosphate triphosphohydrolase SAMHD1 isoform X1 [Ictalurus punctatus]|uniref:Deoxynucleoside triphosphate triphosphohydrolase SAMHD1 isoform X1 n=1 Tax=Ictalurus punctatus TaxID=7998 RepID=A0A9F7TBA4_ICTPU|nr:deoxynucleoside triphosphate triphosphohydrolase SAMHD1 isoform X1 [Ictalurus punctatus]XP_053530220.1 deoxynucleoside triphosphate triphosphohydrolase SAMHD1 isoform X1 [Ictalurus punctatus]